LRGFEGTVRLLGVDINEPAYNPLLMTPALEDSDLQAALSELSADWKVEERPDERGDRGVAVELVRAYRFASFDDVIQFMAEAARFISATDHHPAWENEYRTLRVRLSTWDAKGRISSKDVRLARYLDALFREYAART
jgi:pterin-4a-carbinolamine dehydratase